MITCATFIHRWSCSTILRYVCESGREATATAEFCFLLKEAPPNVFAGMYIYIRPNSFDISNVFQIWNFIFQRGPQQMFLLKCIYTLEQISLIYQCVSNLKFYISKRAPANAIARMFIKCVSNLKFRISYFNTNIIAQMYI